jgi:hypothetical protein
MAIRECQRFFRTLLVDALVLTIAQHVPGGRLVVWSVTTTPGSR